MLKVEVDSALSKKNANTMILMYELIKNKFVGIDKDVTIRFRQEDTAIKSTLFHQATPTLKVSVECNDEKLKKDLLDMCEVVE